MKYHSEIHHRHSIRLRGYDYRQSGAYFITICTFQKQGYFGEIQNEMMYLNPTGKIIQQQWFELNQHFQNIQLDAFICMPNHLHGVLFQHVHIDQLTPNHTLFLGKIIRNFKARTARLIRLNTDENFGWQRNYYERIIRNENELNNVRAYIQNNPQNWAKDDLYFNSNL